MKLTHVDDAGNAHLVDVGDKPTTRRTAIADGWIAASPEAIAAVRAGTARKGDVLGVAQIAGIQAAKRTADLIPLCHPLPLTAVRVTFAVHDDRITATAEVRTEGQTGVEMEALTAVSVALLTVYDMLKAIDRGMQIGGVQLREKHGGRSGDWVRA